MIAELHNLVPKPPVPSSDTPSVAEGTPRNLASAGSLDARHRCHRHFRNFGTSKVTVIHNHGTEDEDRFETEAHIQAKTAFFAVDTPIHEGDVVEFPDPRGGVAQKMAATVDVNIPTGPSFRGMEHIHVTWGTEPPARVAPVRRLSVENLHAEVVRSSSDLFADGHYEAAVSEAFKSIEVRVRTITGSAHSGVKLMGESFGSSDPRVSVANARGQSGKDEREGFAALFRGSMLGVRNPRAHRQGRCGDAACPLRWRTRRTTARRFDLFQPQDPQQTLEYLGFASLLHRQLDNATLS